MQEQVDLEKELAELDLLHTKSKEPQDPTVPPAQDDLDYLDILHEGSKPKIPAQKPVPKESLLEKADRAGYQALMGPTEGIANIGTGVAGWMAGKGAGIAKLIYDTWKTGGRGSWEDAEETAKQVAQKVSSVGGLYQPQTQMGQDLARTVALPWEVGNKVIGKGAETVSDDPETQAGIKYVGEILLGLLGGKAVHGAGKAVAGKVRGIVGDAPVSMPFPSTAQGGRVARDFATDFESAVASDVAPVLQGKKVAGSLYGDNYGNNFNYFDLEKNLPTIKRQAKSAGKEVHVSDYDNRLGKNLNIYVYDPKKVRIILRKNQIDMGPEEFFEFADSVGFREGTPEKIAIDAIYKYEKPTTQTSPLGTAISPVKQMIGAIKQLKPLRKEQEAMYTKERAQRFAKARGVGQKTSGEAGYRAELSQLKGELQKVTFEPIREAFTEENINFLVDEVKHHPLLSYTDTLTARKGLAKIFGEEGANLPTAGELQLLSRVFGKEFTSAVRSNWSTWKKVKHSIFETVNIPRSLMASFDASAPLRQGLMLIGRKEFYSSFKDMFKYIKGDKHKALLEDIAQRETYPLMQRSRLDLTEMGAALGKREERFMSHWGEKIPLGIGKGVEVSGRLYSGFLNKLRADVFDSLIKDAERLGLDPKGNPKLTQDIASFINSATGRGRLPVGDEMGTFLNSFFFSPRLVKARVDFMNPGWYMKLDPFARKQALKSLLTVAGAGMTTLGMAKALGGEVGDDPRSTDFGKIKVGNTRIDLWGGYQQYVVMASRLIANKTVSSTTGKVSRLGKGYKPNTRLGVLGRAVEYKEAPVFSFATALLKGQGAMGEDLKVEKEAMDRMIPMVIQDIVDIYKDDPNLLPLSALGVFGMGLQTYEPKKGIVR